MRLEGSENGRRNAKRLRKEMTPPEIGLCWRFVETKRACASASKLQRVSTCWTSIAPARLAVEVDGEAHFRGDRPARDAVRDKWLAEHGVQVLRYRAVDVLSNWEGVVGHIMTAGPARRDIFES